MPTWEVRTKGGNVSRASSEEQAKKWESEGRGEAYTLEDDGTERRLITVPARAPETKAPPATPNRGAEAEAAGSVGERAAARDRAAADKASATAAAQSAVQERSSSDLMRAAELARSKKSAAAPTPSPAPDEESSKLLRDSRKSVLKKKASE